MKNTLNKTKVTAIALVLLMASVLLTLYTPVQAQYTNMQDPEGIPLPPGVTPDVRIATHPGLSFRPNPVGVGQTILVNIWINPPITNARTLTGYMVTLTDPDGNEDVIGPLESYSGDTTAWFEYVVDQVGTWKVRFDFPGNYWPPGNYTSGQLIGFSSYGRVFSFPDSCYYEPSTTGDKELVVQEEQVLSWPPSPLPTDYWTRPISPENREWKDIAGNWPWPYANNYDYGGPYTIGPTSAHIVWKRQDNIAGLVGGELGQLTDSASGNVPSVIYSGRCYDTMTIPIDGVPTSCAVCYDLRTGEIYYAIPTSEGGRTPSLISYMRENLPPVEGAIADQDPVVRLMTLGSTMRWIDPWDGSIIEECPGMSGALYKDPYVLSVQNLGGGNYRLINWTSENLIKAGGFTSVGTNQNFTQRIDFNVSFPFSSYNVADYNALIGVRTENIADDASGITRGTRILGVSLKTGQLLWNITTNHVQYSGSTRVADQGKFCFAIRDETGGKLAAWNLNDGSLAWISEEIEWPWGFAGAYSVASAYGLVYRYSYAGVTAFDWDTGKKVWQFQAPAIPYETPYSSGVDSAFYSFNSGSKIADGKMYVANSEHSQSQPYTRGYRLFCINATSGEGIWNITGSWGTPGPIADGYLTAGNSYNGYMYVFGKGKSATTVEAPLTAIPLGESIMIKGTVLDMSPAQPGTPCVSKDSMAGWMEYLHMQRPIPMDVTGVPVSLDTLDPNGNFVHIGDVTSDMSGMFKKMWTPEVPGEYTVMATFMGDDSYGSSYAETAVGVVEAPEPAPEYGTPEWPAYPEPEKAADYTPMFLGLTAAIVVVAILVVYDIISVRKLRK